MMVSSQRSCGFQNEYTSAYGLRDSNENIAVPSLIQGSERYSVIPNSSLAAKKTQSAADPFTNSSYSNDDPNLPPSYLLPSTSSQYPIGSFYKSKGDIALGDIGKRGICSWKPGPLKTPGMHCGVRELGVVREDTLYFYQILLYNPEESFVLLLGYRFTDPVSGAPPEYIQRLSELAALECETIHQEKSRRTRKSRKLEM
ncbi:putative uncharacterized protein C8orf89 [Varanus komodoensis]|nr:putative uncharacterized protein C8orf89 [Varanus komodoensis]